jgi:hypothetical protein
VRYCFGQKINHILRTTDLHLTEDFPLKFDRIKKKILCSLLGQFDPDSIPDWTWTQSCIPSTYGGLGLDESSTIRFAAFLGSVVDCMETTTRIVPDWPDSHIQTAANVIEAMEFVQETSTIHLDHPVIFPFRLFLKWEKLSIKMNPMSLRIRLGDSMTSRD